jgi:hypothetical protein
VSGLVVRHDESTVGHDHMGLGRFSRHHGWVPRFESSGSRRIVWRTMQSDRLDSSPSFLGRKVVSPLSVSRSTGQRLQKRMPLLVKANCLG